MDLVAALPRRDLDRTAQRTVPEDRHLAHVVVPPLVEGRRVQEVRDMKKPRSPSWCRGPWSLRSLEAPVRRWTRRLEPQGPCLPAGPPELLLGLLREGAAVHAANLSHKTHELQDLFFSDGRAGRGAASPSLRTPAARRLPPR